MSRHLDQLFKRRAVEKAEKKGLEHRPWYGTFHQWIAEGLRVSRSNINDDHLAGEGKAEEDNDIYVVSFNENFVRCPISKEPFETFWDDEEGGLMFRNAVKVLVTEERDEQLFGISKPTDVEGVRYCIVHKLLVIDGWMETRKATRLSTLESDDKEKYAEAAGEDDEEDVFVVTANALTS